MKIKFIAFVLLIALCGCAHPLIGKNVNTFNKYWCRISATGDGPCIIQTEHLKFILNVGHVPETDKYTIAGYIEPVSIGAFSRFHTEKSTFNFFLADDGEITDVISFILPIDNIQGKIPLNLSFKTKEFRSISVSYNFTVS